MLLRKVVEAFFDKGGFNAANPNVANYAASAEGLYADDEENGVKAMGEISRTLFSRVGFEFRRDGYYRNRQMLVTNLVDVGVPGIPMVGSIEKNKNSCMVLA